MRRGSGYRTYPSWRRKRLASFGRPMQKLNTVSKDTKPQAAEAGTERACLLISLTNRDRDPLIFAVYVFDTQRIADPHGQSDLFGGEIGPHLNQPTFIN